MSALPARTRLLMVAEAIDALAASAAPGAQGEELDENARVLREIARELEEPTGRTPGEVRRPTPPPGGTP
jgi:hypothetical protein